MKFSLKNPKISILLGVICSLLVIGVGSSFAYFAATVNVDNKLTGGKTNTASKALQIKYDAGSSAINMANAYPGMPNVSKTFTVTVTPGTNDTSATYFIHFNITENTFAACSTTNKTSTNNCTVGAQELTYTLTGVDGASKNILTKSGDLTAGVKSVGPFQVTQTTSGGVASTYTYTLTISFKNTNADQNHNINKSFKGSISVQYN